jgi:hypothetical protein
MSVWSGNGGSVISTPAVGGPFTLAINKWTLRKHARLTENTTSANTASNYEKVVPDYSWTLDIAWDDTTLPDTDLGLNEGDKVILKFNYGRSTKFSILTDTTIETADEVDDNATDIVRVALSGKGGTLTRPVT